MSIGAPAKSLGIPQVDCGFCTRSCIPQRVSGSRKSAFDPAYEVGIPRSEKDPLTRSPPSPRQGSPARMGWLVVHVVIDCIISQVCV